MAFSRFACHSAEEKSELLDNVDAENTKRSTKTAVKVLTDYLTEKDLPVDFVNLPKEELNSLLENFYLETRNAKGEHYKKTTLVNYRHGIQRYISANRTLDTIDITKGDDFCSSKRAFLSMKKELKKVGKGAINHHPCISDSDIEKAYTYVTQNLEDAAHLQYKVFMDIMLHFGWRGRENLTDLTRKDFAVTQDDSGSLYVYQTNDEKTKNHQDDDEKASDGHMYEIKGSDRCPVRSFVKYVRRLNPLCHALFQKPRKEPNEGIYFDNMKLGHNKLGSFMADISKLAGLSMRYTNHTLRATTVNTLDVAQFPSRHIMSVTGHKVESSLKTYAGKTSNSTKKLMSNTINKKLCGKFTPGKQETGTCSKIDLDDINIENMEPLTNSQADALVKDLAVYDNFDEMDDFLNDDNGDNILATRDTNQTYVQRNNIQVNNRNMDTSDYPFPMPVFNNCQNIHINFNYRQ